MKKIIIIYAILLLSSCSTMTTDSKLKRRIGSVEAYHKRTIYNCEKTGECIPKWMERRIKQ